MATLINAERHLLDVFFTVPEQFDRERAATDHFGSPTLQEFTGLSRFTGHKWLPILIDHIDKN
jgi:hypothetical protein